MGFFALFPSPKNSRRVDAGTLWRPGSSSDWCRVSTDDGDVYWWNRVTRTSQWHPPVQEEEVAEEEEEYEGVYGFEDEDVSDDELPVDRFAHAAVRPWRLCVFHLAGRCDAGWRCTFAHGHPSCADSSIGDPGWYTRKAFGSSLRAGAFWTMLRFFEPLVPGSPILCFGVLVCSGG